MYVSNDNVRPWAAVLPTVRLAIILLSFLGAAPSTARTISVPGDSPSIKGAMIRASAGDIILVACGTYRESDIQVKPGVSLWSGTLQPGCVTIDAGNRGRCLIFINADAKTSVVGFTLRGGQATGTGEEGFGGAILCVDSSPRITRCFFVGNQAEQGGALAALGRGGPLLEQCRFVDNEALRHGGAVLWQASGGSLIGCVLQANLAYLSGGALAGNGGSLAISNCLFRDNHAGNIGGAISLSGTVATLDGSVLALNTGGLAGGALALSGTSPDLKQCTFDGNTADGDGTVLRLDRANPTLTGCLITGSDNALVDAFESRPLLTRSNVFGAGGTGWPAVLTDQQHTAGNISSDPLYCSVPSGDYHLRAGSPCLTPGSAAAIGALGQGCGAQFPKDVID